MLQKFILPDAQCLERKKFPGELNKAKDYSQIWISWIWFEPVRSGSNCLSLVWTGLNWLKHACKAGYSHGLRGSWVHLCEHKMPLRPVQAGAAALAQADVRAGSAFRIGERQIPVAQRPVHRRQFSGIALLLLGADSVHCFSVRHTASLCQELSEEISLLVSKNRIGEKSPFEDLKPWVQLIRNPRDCSLLPMISHLWASECTGSELPVLSHVELIKQTPEVNY